MYAALGTRPDICAAVNFYSQFQTCATDVQWKGLKRILRYLQGTSDYGLWFRSPAYTPLTVYADADFARDLGRKSNSGYLLK